MIDPDNTDTDPKIALRSLLRPGMSCEEIAMHALSGIEFSSMESAQGAIRQVAAAIEIMAGTGRTRPIMVKG